MIKLKHFIKIFKRIVQKLNPNKINFYLKPLIGFTLLVVESILSYLANL